MDEVSPRLFASSRRGLIPVAAKKSFSQGIRASQNFRMTFFPLSRMRTSKAAERENYRVKAAI
jgi:hypothetical protein